MSRMNNARKGIGFGIINNLLNILLPFVSRTIIIYALGNQYVGLSGLFVSIINVLNISELGFSAAVSYILYKPVADGDDDKVCAILGFARKCFAIIGSVVLAGGLIVLPFLKRFISGDVPSDINIYILYLFYLGNVVVSYLMFSYKRILFSANQRYDIETNISSVTLLIQYVLQIVLLLIFKNYYLYAIVIPIMTICNNLLCQYISKKKYPQYFCKGKISKSEIDALKKKVGGSFFSKVGETIYLSVSNIVISSFFGLVILGQYGNYYYVITSLIAIFAVIHNTMRPIIGNCIVTEDKNKNFQRFLDFDNIYIWVSAFCTACLLSLYQDFIFVWVGKENMFAFILVILFALNFFVGRISCVPSLYIEASGLWWESRYVTLAAALTNLVLAIVLSAVIGLEGVLIASIISSLCIMFGGRLIILFKYYFNKEQRKKYIKTVLLICVSSIGCILVTFFVSNFISAENILLLLIKGVVVVGIFGVSYLLLNVGNKNSRRIWKIAFSFIGIDKIINKLTKRN
ncbi:MAG: oligosaccharide flippase family protein [Clostridia bacterium]|nr:oligosaccharide flippase family protein [Clostridia bacterium]